MQETSTYEQQAIDFLSTYDVKFTTKYIRYGFYFADDKEKRDIYECALSRKDGKHYTFTFGQSIFNSTNKKVKPTAYDVLSSLTKHDPGAFENFCSEFGYDIDSRKAYTIYKAVINEWHEMKNLFTWRQLEKLREIQ
jgi:uncharacterized protein (DUF2252 family)